MKKIFLAATLFATVATASVSAQGGPGGDMAARAQKMREMLKPRLVEKAGITSEQADKVLDITMEAQRQRRELRQNAGLSSDDKTKKTTAIDEETARKYKAIPLTDDQVKSLNSFFEETRKNSQGRGSRSEGNGNQ